MCVCLAVKPWGHLWLKLLSGFLQNKHWSCGCRTTAAFTPKLEFLRYVHQVHYCFKSELTLNPPTIYPWVWSHFHSWVLMVTCKHEWNWEAATFTNDANTAICNNVIKKDWTFYVIFIHVKAACKCSLCHPSFSAASFSFHLLPRPGTTPLIWAAC